MVLGTGVDMVDVARMARFHQRWGRHGLRRVFTRDEIEYCFRLARPIPSLAARFAAKEAFFKALGTGSGRGGDWRDVEVVRRDGPPAIQLHGRAREVARAHGVRTSHLSLSHTADLAIAFVILED